jgi:hypothetical protein
MAVNPYGVNTPPYTAVPTPAPSGTTTFNLDISEIVAEAYERCGILVLSGRDYRTARRSLDLMMLDWANRGINLWKIEEASQVITAGDQTYDLPNRTVDIIEAVLRTGTGQNQQDYTLNRISVSTWATLPNKLTVGRPVEYYVDRQLTPTFSLWPMPDATTTYTFVYWALNRIEDTGTPASNTMDVPWRFLPCLCAGLAYCVGQKRPDVVGNRLAELKAAYDEAWSLAAGEDRTRASQRFVPYIPYIGS